MRIVIVSWPCSDKGRQRQQLGSSTSEPPNESDNADHSDLTPCRSLVVPPHSGLVCNILNTAHDPEIIILGMRLIIILLVH